MVHRIKKNVSVICNGTIWFSGKRVHKDWSMKLFKLRGFETEKITEVDNVR